MNWDLTEGIISLLVKVQIKITILNIRKSSTYYSYQANLTKHYYFTAGELVWQTVNEVSKRKSTSKAKLKAANQEERIHMWKEHFKNLLGKSPKFKDNPITKINNNQLDIKLSQFTKEKLDVVLRKIKCRKVAGLDDTYIYIYIYIYILCA